MTPFDEDVLQLAMRMTQAWERLHDPEYSGKLCAEDLLELVLRAGYSASAAQKAAKQRGWDRMQAGLSA